MTKTKQRFLESMHPYGFNEGHLGNAYDEIMRLSIPFYPLPQVEFFGEDKVFYELHIARHEKNPPYLQGYKATLRSVPPIKHGVFGGIDTALLEKRMLNVDWFKTVPGTTILPPESAKELVAIWKIFEQLKKVNDPQATDIAQLLQMKHWAGTFVQNLTSLDLMTVRYDRSYYFNVRKDHKGIDAVQAYNLLSGRYVRRESGLEKDMTNPHWLGLKRISEPSTTNWFDEYQYPDFDLKKALEINSRQYYLPEINAKLINQLQNGDRLEIWRSSGSSCVHMQADPAHQTVLLQQQIGDDTINLKRVSARLINPKTRKNKGHSL